MVRYLLHIGVQVRCKIEILINIKSIENVCILSQSHYVHRLCHHYNNSVLEFFLVIMS